MKGQEVKEALGSPRHLEPISSELWLEKAIEYLEEMIAKLERARVSIRELREWYGDYRA